MIPTLLDILSYSLLYSLVEKPDTSLIVQIVSIILTALTNAPAKMELKKIDYSTKTKQKRRPEKMNIKTLKGLYRIKVWVLKRMFSLLSLPIALIIVMSLAIYGTANLTTARWIILLTTPWALIFFSWLVMVPINDYLERRFPKLKNL